MYSFLNFNHRFDGLWYTRFCLCLRVLYWRSKWWSSALIWLVQLFTSIFLFPCRLEQKLAITCNRSVSSYQVLYPSFWMPRERSFIEKFCIRFLMALFRIMINMPFYAGGFVSGGFGHEAYDSTIPLAVPTSSCEYFGISSNSCWQQTGLCDRHSILHYLIINQRKSQPLAS